MLIKLGLLTAYGIAINLPDFQELQAVVKQLILANIANWNLV
jgi:hypothetical protein